MKQRNLAPGLPVSTYGTEPNQVARPLVLEPSGTDSRPTESTRVTDGSRLKTLVSIPVFLIDPSPLPPREIYTPEMIKDRALDLHNQGQHDPIHVTPNPKHLGRFIIIDGWTRVRACVDHSVLTELFAEVHNDLTTEQAAWYGYHQNEGRTQHCDYDRAAFYERLIATGISQADILRGARLSTSAMSRYRAFAKLPQEIIALIVEQPLKFGAAAADLLAKLYVKQGLRRALALAHQFAEENKPVRWLANEIQAIVCPKAPKKADTLKRVAYANGHYRRTDSTFEISMRVPPDKQNEFAAALEALLDSVAELSPEADIEPDPAAHGSKDTHDFPNVGKVTQSPEMDA